MATAVDTIIANIYNDILQLYINNKILHFDETDNKVLCPEQLTHLSLHNCNYNLNY